MKTIRTIIATLSGVLLTFALVAWFSVRRNARASTRPSWWPWSWAAPFCSSP